MRFARGCCAPLAPTPGHRPPDPPNQVPHVYVAELVRLDDLGLLGEIGMFDRLARPRLLYVAASPECAFLLGNSLDPAALTHRHFVEESRQEYLDVAVRDHLEALRFFRDIDVEALRSGRERYIAVPFFDRAGAAAGFIALDTIGASPAGAAAAEEPWVADLLHAVAEFLGRAAADSRGLAEDYDDLHGPVFFARRLVEIANGRIGGREQPPDGLATIFLERYGFLMDLATRNRSALGEGVELPPPAKRYFVPREQLAHAQLGNLKDLRLTLQEELIGAASEAELRLLRAAERPPRETLKVWRAVFVLVGSADREVLSTLEDAAWARVQALLADSRPARERLPRLMASLNPLVPRNMERADNLEQVYHLAQGLVLTIDTARLMTEGRLAVLLLEWVLVIFLIRQMESSLMAPENAGASAGE